MSDWYRFITQIQQRLNGIVIQRSWMSLLPKFCGLPMCGFSFYSNSPFVKPFETRTTVIVKSINDLSFFCLFAQPKNSMQCGTHVFFSPICSFFSFSSNTGKMNAEYRTMQSVFHLSNQFLDVRRVKILSAL